MKQRKLSKFVALSLVVAMSASLLAGCGDSGDSGSDATSQEDAGTSGDGADASGDANASDDAGTSGDGADASGDANASDDAGTSGGGMDASSGDANASGGGTDASGDAGASGGGADASGDANAPDGGAGDADASGDAGASGDYGADTQAIVDRGVLRVGVKNAVIGFGFQDTVTGEYSGMEISIAEKIAESLGVDIEFTPVTAATRTELLDSGDIDCAIATFTITDERKESWDFSTPYYTDYVSVLVEDSSGIKTLADLVDKKVGVSSGSTSACSLTSEMISEGLISGDGFDEETFDPATWTEGISFQQYDDYPAISTALSAGEVDAFCVDKSILVIYDTEGRSYIKEQFAPQEYGVATTKGSDFSTYVEGLITAWLADGTIDVFIAEYGWD